MSQYVHGLGHLGRPCRPGGRLSMYAVSTLSGFGFGTFNFLFTTLSFGGLGCVAWDVQVLYLCIVGLTAAWVRMLFFAPRVFFVLCVFSVFLFCVFFYFSLENDATHAKHAQACCFCSAFFVGIIEKTRDFLEKCKYL